MASSVIDEYMDVETTKKLGTYDIREKNLTTILSSDNGLFDRDKKSALIKEGYANSFTIKTISDRDCKALKNDQYLAVEDYMLLDWFHDDKLNVKVSINVDHDLFYDKNTQVAIFQLHKDKVTLVIGRRKQF